MTSSKQIAQDEGRNRKLRLKELVDSQFSGLQIRLLEKIRIAIPGHNQGEISQLVKPESSKSFGYNKAGAIAKALKLHRDVFELPVGSPFYAEDEDIPRQKTTGASDASSQSNVAKRRPVTAREKLISDIRGLAESTSDVGLAVLAFKAREIAAEHPLQLKQTHK